MCGGSIPPKCSITSSRCSSSASFSLLAQIHEPILATGGAASLRNDTEAAYATLAAAGVPLHIVVPYDDVDEEVYSWLVNLPCVQAIGLDFCGVPGAAHGCATAKLIAKHGFPKVPVYMNDQ